jgi:hypothetical protein
MQGTYFPINEQTKAKSQAELQLMTTNEQESATGFRNRFLTKMSDCQENDCDLLSSNRLVDLFLAGIPITNIDYAHLRTMFQTQRSQSMSLNIHDVRAEFMKIDDAIEVQHEQANLAFNDTDHDYTEDEQDSHSENEETDSQSQYENDYDDESTDPNSYNDQDFYEEYANSVHLHEANSVTLIKENEQVIEGESKTEHSVKGESEIQYDIEGESDSDDETSITSDTPMSSAIRDLDHPILRRTQRNIKKPGNYTPLAFSAELQDYQHPTFLALETLAEAETKNSPIERYLPELLSCKAVMQCDPIERRGCLKAIASELKNLNNIKPSQIVVFSDASFQDCPDDGKSTTGYMIFTAGGLIEANSSVPTPVAMSTCESEYMAAARAGMAAAHAYMIYYDYQKLGTKDYDFAQVTPEKPPIIIMTDNKAAVRLSINDMMKKGTRHIARRFHYVKEGTKSGIHTVQYCKAEDMLADIATKSQISSKSLPQLLRAMHDLPKHLRVQYGDKQSPKGSEEKQVASTTG